MSPEPAAYLGDRLGPAGPRGLCLEAARLPDWSATRILNLRRAKERLVASPSGAPTGGTRTLGSELPDTEDLPPCGTTPPEAASRSSPQPGGPNPAPSHTPAEYATGRPHVISPAEAATLFPSSISRASWLEDGPRQRAEQEASRQATRRRNIQRSARPAVDQPTPISYTAVQLNVGTLTAVKRAALRLYLAKRSAAVVTLQEVYGNGGKPPKGTYLQGYVVYDSEHRQGAAGSRGVAIAVDSRYTSWSYGPPSETVVAADVRTVAGVDLWVTSYLCNVALGSSGTAQQKAEWKADARAARVGAIKTVANRCRDFREQYPAGNIFWTGDMNASVQQFEDRIMSHLTDDADYSRVALRGEREKGSGRRLVPTHCRITMPRRATQPVTHASQIDHVVTRRGCAISTSASVDACHGDLSDTHLPVVIAVTGSLKPLPHPEPRFSVKRDLGRGINAVGDEVKKAFGNNRFASLLAKAGLLDLAADTTPEQMAHRAVADRVHTTLATVLPQLPNVVRTTDTASGALVPILESAPARAVDNPALPDAAELGPSTATAGAPSPLLGTATVNAPPERAVLAPPSGPVPAEAVRAVETKAMKDLRRDVSTDFNTLVEGFKEAFLSTNLATEGKKRFVPTHVPTALRSKIRSTRQSLQNLRRAVRLRKPMADILLATSRYQQTKAECAEHTSALRRARWNKFVRTGTEAFRNGDFRKGWRFVRQLTGQSRSSTGLQPVRDSDGILQSEPDQILRTWAEHFGGLCADKDGMSRDASKWAGRTDGITARDTCLDKLAPLTYEVFCRLMFLADSGKAPGPSGLHVEALRACLHAPEDFDAVRRESEGDGPPPQPLQPDNHAALTLYYVAKLVYHTGVVLVAAEISEVILIFKKGEVEDPGNYRGIALIEVLIKQITAFATGQISMSLERTGFYTKSQGGFRAGEESVAQFTALWEVCTRRKVEGKPTYLFFSDLRKAYDVVGHVAMLTKLSAAGVRGEAFQIVRGLYHDPSISVKLASGQTSVAKEYARGLRQGCSGSPQQFLIFINDLVDGLIAEELGVSVPTRPPTPAAGLTEEDLGPGGVVDLLCALLFADDTVVVTGNLEDLTRSVQIFEQWAEKWGMQFGVTKCGLMIISPDWERSPPDQSAGTGSGSEVQDEGEVWGELITKAIAIGGEPVPIVRKYEYLGLLFNRYLDVGMVVEHRAASGLKTLKAVRRLIGSSAVPLGTRVLCFSALVLSTLTYGGEFFGMWGGTFQRAEVALRPLQNVMNTGLRMVSKATWDMTGKGTGYHTSTAALLLELDLPSIAAICAGKAARALVKWRQTSKCWIRDLIVDQPARQPTGPGSTQPWSHADLKSAYYTQIVGYVNALQDWHDKHGLVDPPPSPPGEQDGDAAEPLLEGWRPRVLYGCIRWATSGSLLVVPHSPRSKSQRRAAVTAATLSRKAGSAVKFLTQARGIFAGANPKKLKPGATTRVLKRGMHLSARWFLNLTERYPELSPSLHWLSRIRGGRFYSWAELVKLGEKIPPLAEKLPTVPSEQKCPLCKSCEEADSSVHFVFNCCAPELQKIRGELDLKASARKLVSHYREFSEVTQNPCSVVNSRQHYNDEDLLTLIAGGSVGGRLTSVLRGCAVSSDPYTGFATHPFERETRATARGQPDERISQVPGLTKAWMERHCLGIGDYIAEDDTTAFRTKCWYAEAAAVLLARYLRRAIPIRNRILWGIKTNPL